MNKTNWFINNYHNVLILSAAIIISCVQEYNPFEDLQNVKVIYSTSFNDNQQLTIFSPETLYIEPLVKERIDSFSISAPGNIFWTDTTIRSDSVQLDQLYPFVVSFKDTGLIEIVTTTHLSNTQSIKRITDQIYVHSPLSQKPLAIYLGNNCTLSTPGVKEENVVYNWSFGDDLNFSNKTPLYIMNVTTSPTHSEKCSLWLSDTLGIHTSPKIPFEAAFYDSFPPIIMYKNYMGTMEGDTIYSSTINFIFMTEIYDQGNSSVEKTWINNHPFEYCELSKNLYWNVFEKSKLVRNNEPQKITVKAEDQFSNIVTKEFWLLFNTTLEQDDITILTVDNPDSETVSDNDHWITGKVYSYSPDSLVLTNAVNEIDTMCQPYIIPPDSHTVTWKWNITLDEGYNNVSIRLHKKSDKSMLIEKLLSVFLYVPVVDTGAVDTGAVYTEPVDTVKPLIISIIVNDTLPYTGSEIFFPEDSITISVNAMDGNSGIATIYIDTTELYYKDQEQHWRNKVYLSHDTKMKKLLSVYDSSANKATRYLNIFKNTKPKPITTGLIQPLLYIGREYHDSISLFDMENDSLTLTFIKIAPWTANGTNLYCKPTYDDSGQGSIVFMISDGLQNSDTYIWDYTVIQDPVSVEFDDEMMGSLFDTILEGSNQNSIHLSVKNGTLPYHYTVILSPVNTVLLDTSVDSTLLWTPTIQDTGNYTLCFYVEDINHKKDTLLDLIYVKPDYPEISGLTMTVTPDSIPVIGDTVDASNLIDNAQITLNFLIDSVSRGIYRVTVHSQDTLVNQFEIDNNQFSIEKTILKSIKFDTTIVKVTDHWENFRTKTIFLKHRKSIIGAAYQAMTFENTSYWNFINGTSGTLSNDTSTTTQGNASIQIGGNGWQHIQSIDLNTADFKEISSDLKFDIYAGPTQPDPLWGELQFYVNCPSAGINNLYIGNAILENLSLGMFTTVTISLPSNVLTALNGNYNDFSFSIALNTSPGSGPYYIDNMRF